MSLVLCRVGRTIVITASTFWCVPYFCISLGRPKQRVDQRSLCSCRCRLPLNGIHPNLAAAKPSSMACWAIAVRSLELATSRTHHPQILASTSYWISRNTPCRIRSEILDLPVRRRIEPFLLVPSTSPHPDLNRCVSHRKALSFELHEPK